METRQNIVVTTINSPTPAVKALAKYFPGWTLTVVGDNKTPTDWTLPGVAYFGMADQRDMPYSLAGLLPENHYCRKNLGYLAAMSQGAQKIAETDDDNTPTAWPLGEARREVSAPLISGAPWFNVYEKFTSEFIWPRGFPLELLAASRERFGTSSAESATSELFCPVQQYLAEGDPDVDAVYRLTIGKIDHKFQDRTVVLDQGVMVPFNSQSTVWFPEAYPYMYLPSFVSFRMTDIWRSFIAQVGLWAHGAHLAYHGQGVRQDRNDHDLMIDFNDEVIGYQRNAEIVDTLKSLSLESDWTAAGSNLMACYEALHKINVISAQELPLVEAWVRDLERA